MFYFISSFRRLYSNSVLILAGLLLAGCPAALFLLAGGGAGVATGTGAILGGGNVRPLPASILPFTSELNRAVLAPNGARLYAIDRLHNTLNIYNTASRKLVSVIDIPEIVDNRFSGAFSNSRLFAHLAISPNGERLYLALPGAQGLSVIDTSNLRRANSFVENVATNPVDLKVSTNNNRVFIANGGELDNSDSVTRNGNVVIVNANNLQTRTLTTIPNEVAGGTDITFSNPASLVQSPTSNHLYVADQGGDSLIRVNLSTLQGTVINLGRDSGPVSVDVTPDGSQVLVSNRGSNRISLVNSETLAVANFANNNSLDTVNYANTVNAANNPNDLTTSLPGAVVISPDGKWGFIANTNPIAKPINTQVDDVQLDCPSGLRSLGIFNLKERQFIAGGSLLVDPEISGIAISTYEDEKQNINFQKAYVASSCPGDSDANQASFNSTNSVAEIDLPVLTTNPQRAITNIPIPGQKAAFSIAIQDDGSEVYVVHADAITVLDTKPSAGSRATIAGRIAARGPGPFDMALSENPNMLVTANTGAKSASLIDTANFSTQRVPLTVAAPGTVVTANGNAYVANSGTYQSPGDSVSVIDLATAMITGSLIDNSDDGRRSAPHTLAVTPDGDKLVVGYLDNFDDVIINDDNSGFSLFDLTDSNAEARNLISSVNASKVIAPDNNFSFFAYLGDGDVKYQNFNRVSGSDDDSEIVNTSGRVLAPIDMAYHRIDSASGKFIFLDYVGSASFTHPNERFDGASAWIYDVDIDNNGDIDNTTRVMFANGSNPVRLGNQAASSILIDDSGSNLRAFITHSGDKQFNRCQNLDNELESCGTGNSVSIVDLNEGTLIDTIEGVGSRPMNIVKANGKAYVPAYFSNHVAVIDLNQDRLLQPIPVGNGPVKAVTDGQRVYVANSIDGTVTVINSQTDEVIRAAVPINPTNP